MHNVWYIAWENIQLSNKKCFWPDEPFLLAQYRNHYTAVDKKNNKEIHTVMFLIKLVLQIYQGECMWEWMVACECLCVSPITNCGHCQGFTPPKAPPKTPYHSDFKQLTNAELCWLVDGE